MPAGGVSSQRRGMRWDWNSRRPPQRAGTGGHRRQRWGDAARGPQRATGSSPAGNPFGPSGRRTRCVGLVLPISINHIYMLAQGRWKMRRRQTDAGSGGGRGTSSRAAPGVRPASRVQPAGKYICEVGGHCAVGQARLEGERSGRSAVTVEGSERGFVVGGGGEGFQPPDQSSELVCVCV